jgi:hypothetical protein
MNTYKVPVTWREYGYVFVKAKSIEEAAIKANDEDLPHDNSEYLEGSFEIDYHAIRAL